MECVKTYEGVLPHRVVTYEEELYEVAHERRRRRTDHVHTHRHCPERKLIPGQQIARVAEQEGEHQQNYTNDPVELARCAERTGVKDAAHMEEDHNYHAVGGPSVHVAQEPPERLLGL